VQPKVERIYGVGCEGCHGPAERWLAPHTSISQWKQLSAADKANKYGMTPLDDVFAVARSCVGCHVGAPPDTVHGIPAREVNHDFIVAGHPRLNFEFTSYLATLPAHWNVAAKRRDATYWLRTWQVGQLVTAEASLNLLAFRAQAAQQQGDQELSWPEFSEYDCFACHHDLRLPSWRQDRVFGQRRSGTLPWGTWYYSLLPTAAVSFEADGLPTLATLRELTTEMESPFPDSGRCQAGAEKTAIAIREWLKQLQTQTTNSATGMFIDVLAKHYPHLAERNWDSATQLCAALSCVAAAQAAETDDRTDARRSGVLRAIQMLENQLGFPDGYQSPAQFHHDSDLAR
jgi:hypothetical protein